MPTDASRSPTDARSGGPWLLPALLLLLATLVPSSARADELVLTTSFTYNENDAVETVTTPDGVVATLAYDEVDRPVSLSYSQGAGGVSAITYTDLGQVASVTDTEGTIEFHYDPRFHGLTDIFYPGGDGSLHHAYDGFGRVINTRAGGAGSGESYRYDREGRIEQVSADHGATTTNYDPLTGRLTSVQLGSGITESYTYDSVTGEVTTVTQERAGGGLIALYSHTYYANGLKESVTETSPERGTETVTYEYDELQRLSRAIYDLADLSQRIENYEYDANGNRLRRHVTLDNETVEDTRYRYNGLNQIVQAGNEVIYHNARGNIVKRITPGAVLRETTYEWDSANRLVGVTKKEDNQEVLSISYRYNALGQRIERSVNRPGHPLETKSYVNSTGELYQPLKIEDGGGTTVVYPGGNAYQRGGKVRYELGGIGGVTRVMGGNGQLVASYRYDAFGRILESEGEATGERAKRYRGEDWDEESGLLYLRNRYYDPDLGRFLSIDPHPGYATRPQTLNPYVYCHNDPVNFADPTGLCSDEIRSPEWMRYTIPGQIAWDSAQTEWQRGNYGSSILAGGVMVVEQLFTVLTFGQGGAVFQSSRLYTNTVTKGLGNQNAMFKSALQPFKNTSFTQAGRAVTKHPEYFRFDDLASLRKVYNTPDKINRLAADLLKDIMRNGKVTTGAGGRYPGGWKTVTLPDGRAASWHANGDFIGFRGVQP